MIEALSDSTIYMAYYTIAHLLEEIRAEEMNDEFDYVFLGKESANTKQKTQNSKSFVKAFCTGTVDSRHSAGDLIRNHLTLIYLFILRFLKRNFGQNN